MIKYSIMQKKFLYLALIPGLVWADRFVYDGLSVGMNLAQVYQANYLDCEADTSMGANWTSCTSEKNFFPPFLGYNIDDVEVELANGKTVAAINLITSSDVTTKELQQKVGGTLTNKGKLSLISIKNHDDSLMRIKGKIAIMNNQRD